MIQLGINIDHIATIRNARGTEYPSLIEAAKIAEENGGDFITIHLREDRRHIREDDLYLLKGAVKTYINLEMACNEDVLAHALKARPQKVTLVPERREELTTEGGLNVKENLSLITDFTHELKRSGIVVSLFIEPDPDQIDNYLKTGAAEIEIHTGKYSDSAENDRPHLLSGISYFAQKAHEAGFRVCAGHGLNYGNVKPLCLIKDIVEYNIGHSIIAEAVFTGLGPAVKKMKTLINGA